MRVSDRKVVVLFFLAGIVVWIFDTVLGYFVFHRGTGTFSDILILHPPRHDLYIRLSALLLFTGLGYIFSHYIAQLQQSRTSLQNIFNNVIPICITNREYEIIGTNSSYDAIFGCRKKDETSARCYDERPGSTCRQDGCPVIEILSRNRDRYTCETVREEQDGTERHFIVTATPLRNPDGEKTGIIETFQDITPRKKLEKEKERLISNLQDALSQVKTLSGFLPICASCKKIRDDKGYWTQIETYIRNHSEAEFSHGICPDCAEEKYGFTQKD